jgi:hypothetical protein
MTTETEVFEIPRHGSYPSDICQWGALLSFSDARPEDAAVAPEVAQIILGFIRRVYPEATEQSLWRYGNKNFTIVGTMYFQKHYVIVYYHDYTWFVGTMPVEEYNKWREERSYFTSCYAAVPENLPQC